MSSLRVFLFGGFQIAHDGDPTPNNKMTRGVKALLAYLLLFRHRVHPREVLAGLFWGDHSEERARSCLSTALWRIRRALEPGQIPKGTYLLTTPTGEVGFNRESDYWLDVAEFEESASRCLAQSVQSRDFVDVCDIENIPILYTGELLEGFYDDWALRERERLRSLYLKSLSHLMLYHRHHGNYEQSLAYGQTILSHDPLREGIHREVMRLYLESGQRAMAIRQYENCSEILKTELGIPPMEETQALYREILNPARSDRSQSVMSRSPRSCECDTIDIALRRVSEISSATKIASLKETFEQLHLAMKDLDKTREKIHKAVAMLEGIAGQQDFKED